MLFATILLGTLRIEYQMYQLASTDKELVSSPFPEEKKKQQQKTLGFD